MISSDKRYMGIKRGCHSVLHINTNKEDTLHIIPEDYEKCLAGRRLFHFHELTELKVNNAAMHNILFISVDTGS